MANIRSAIKRQKQSEKRRQRNRLLKSAMRTHIKTLRQSVADKDAAKAGDALKRALCSVQQVASKGVIHKRTASRLVSRLTRHFNQLQPS